MTSRACSTRKDRPAARSLRKPPFSNRHTRAAAVRRESEARFQASVIQLARLAGWLTFHPYDSRRSTPGYPDLTLARRGRVLHVELKTSDGRRTPAQRDWAEAIGPSYRCWRPDDWPAIEAELAKR